jgi:hypothetical protein
MSETDTGPKQMKITGMDRIRDAISMTQMLPEIDHWTEILMNKRERRLSICIQPKPKWVPLRIWHKIVSRVVVLHEGPTKETKENDSE